MKISPSGSARGLNMILSQNRPEKPAPEEVIPEGLGVSWGSRGSLEQEG